MAMLKEIAVKRVPFLKLASKEKIIHPKNARHSWVFFVCKKRQYQGEIALVTNLRPYVQTIIKIWLYRGSPTYTKITNTVSTNTVFGVSGLSGGISVSRGPQYSPTNTNFM